MPGLTVGGEAPLFDAARRSADEDAPTTGPGLQASDLAGPQKKPTGWLGALSGSTSAAAPGARVRLGGAEPGVGDSGRRTEVSPFALSNDGRGLGLDVFEGSALSFDRGGLKISDGAKSWSFKLKKQGFVLGVKISF